MVVGYSQWLEQQCASIGHTGPVFFALRDAAPLKEAADVLWNGKSIYPVGVYINRPLLGIEDEISPQATNVNGNLVKYLGMLGLSRWEKTVWADTGAWGTVIKALKTYDIVRDGLYPFFWYSHNPFIPGYLNELLSELGANEKMGEVINDSLECVFPQAHYRPAELVAADSGWQVKLEKTNELAAVWGQAALAGVRQAAVDFFGGITHDKCLEAVRELMHAHEVARAKGVCTGVLPENTPTWSKGKKFLADWPANLLP